MQGRLLALRRFGANDFVESGLAVNNEEFDFSAPGAIGGPKVLLPPESLQRAA